MSALPLEDDYAAILRSSRPLIDVRAPAEFAKGAVPGAVNLPLLDDDERAAVGIAYKRRGQRAAVELGHRLVGGEVRRARIDAWRAFAASRPDALIYCWRGGMRSAIAQTWLQESGVTLGRVVGGFKALRRFCLDTIDEASAKRRLILVGGRTGTGKTRVVQKAENHVDLEGLANHRGSAFGGFTTPQPPPVAFENALAVKLLRLPPQATVVLEDESRTIGRLAIPEALFATMQRSPIALLEAPLAERIDNVYREYVAQADNPREPLLAALDRIQRRLGGIRHGEISALMRAAFDADSAAAHRRWIGRLLTDYYDPMYDYQLAAKAERVLMRGDAGAVAAFVAAPSTHPKHVDRIPD